MSGWGDGCKAGGGRVKMGKKSVAGCRATLPAAATLPEKLRRNATWRTQERIRGEAPAAAA